MNLICSNSFPVSNLSSRLLGLFLELIKFDGGTIYFITNNRVISRKCFHKTLFNIRSLVFSVNIK